MRQRLCARVLLAACGLLFLTGCSANPSSSDDKPSTPRSSPSPFADVFDTVPLPDAVARLRRAAENPAGYDRDAFDLYQDLDHDGCDARRETLLAEAVKAPKVTQPGCKLTGGQWFSYYDGATLTDAQKVSIDHVVALSEAWASGARDWPRERLVEYGSYLDDPEHLVGVTQSVNSRKGDKDPAEWLPARDEARCRYVAAFVGVKLGWKLTADAGEREALRDLSNPQHGACRHSTVQVQR